MDGFGISAFLGVTAFLASGGRIVADPDCPDLLSVEPTQPQSSGARRGKGKRARPGRPVEPPPTSEPQRPDYPSRQAYRAAMRRWRG